MINVIIVEDQTLVREGLIRLLDFSASIHVAGSAGSAEEALQQSSSVRPDVVLVDIQLPGMNGFTFIRHYSQQYPLARFIVLTTFDNYSYTLAAHEAGAYGFLLKDVSFTQLVSSIERVAQGEKIFPDITMHVPPVNSLPTAPPHSNEGMQSLTTRERQIFVQIAQGYSNKEIARQLSVSEGTIKNHVSNILSKLDVRDRTQAVIKYGSHLN